MHGARFASVAAYTVASEVRRASRTKGREAVAAINNRGHRLDMTQYPMCLDAYIGQDKAKRQLRAAIARARATHKPLRHTLITSGVPGIGKTGLAAAVSGELGTDMRAVSGKISLKDIRPTLMSMNDGDILFIDEIHLLVVGGKANAEWLLHVLQDGVLMTPTGPEEVPKITVIGATTDAGRLPETILSRFKIHCQLEPYTELEANVICRFMARRSSNPLPDEIIERIVAASAKNPRIMSNLIDSWNDLCYASENPEFAEVLEWQGLTPDGLDRNAQRILVALVTEFEGMAGEATLKSRLREPGGLHFAERVLQEKGYIMFTPNGRSITADGALRGADLADQGVVV